MRVTRVAEHPRITKPFSDAAWADLDALGRKVDAALAEGDVRLTMGGEPTFVSIDDFEAGEWNTDAVGPTKRTFADQLIRRLRDRFAPGGFLHYGQGKWYPGETLPRWTFSLYWRRDGKPVWHDPDLIATEGADGQPTPQQAQTLLTTIAEELGLPARQCRARLRGPRRVDRQGRQPARERDARELEAERPRGAQPHRPRLRARPDRTLGLRAAGAALAGPRGQDLGVREMGAAARAPVPRTRRQPGGLPPAAGRAASCAARRLPLHQPRRSVRGTRRPARPCPRGARTGPRQLHGLRTGAGPRRADDLRPCGYASAPRSRSNRAMAGFASSCRRWSGWRTIWNLSPPPRPPRRSWACPSISKATPRPTIRA